MADEEGVMEVEETEEVEAVEVRIYPCTLHTDIYYEQYAPRMQHLCHWLTVSPYVQVIIYLYLYMYACIFRCIPYGILSLVEPLIFSIFRFIVQ